MLADMTASHVCNACMWCIKEPKMRRSQWIATENQLEFFKRDDIERYLFDPPEPPFVFFVTSSYKKHGSFRARVNDSRKLFYVQFEDRQILFSPSKYRDLFELMKRMYTVFNKTQEIGKGDYIQKRVFEYGLKQWQNDEVILKQHRGSQVFELLVYALNKPEEAKKKQEESMNERRMRNDGRRVKKRRS
jgi:CRISPR type IV-associated protein Csf1